MPRFEVKSWPIWNNALIDIPVQNNGGVPLQRLVPFNYGGLVSAQLAITVTADVWPSWASLYYNGSEIRGYDFRLGSGTDTRTIDVTNQIKLGMNEFVFLTHKQSWVGWGTYKITANLIVDAEWFTPPPPEIPWWIILAIGGTLFAGGVIIILRRKKKKNGKKNNEVDYQI